MEAPLRLSSAAVLDLPGLGRLTVDPGARAEDDLPARLSAAEAGLARALAACGADTVTAARQRLAEADAAREAARQAGELLASLAPAGLEALRAEAAKAAEVAGGVETDPGEDLPVLEAAQRQAEAAESAAAVAAAAARAAAGAASDALARAEAAEQAAAAAVAAAQAEAADAGRLAAAQAAVATAQVALAEAQQAHAALVAAAPDLQTAQAGLERAESAVVRAAKDSGDLARRVAELDGFIRSQADLGIEEELEEVRGRLAEARARAARREGEVRALTRLREALAAARIAAREAYFGPVRQELAPLLAILHDGADLALDDRSLLPVSLTRGGQMEPLEILSGGTAEQIAILTRLAFARLFVRSGRTVPIILDDALVHSDDDRIEAMFTALHRVARDQQILVLTCRQRAFASLGGARAEVRITAAG
ncbi:ATP-binding protein [Frigidibacter albus]